MNRRPQAPVEPRSHVTPEADCNLCGGVGELWFTPNGERVAPGADAPDLAMRVCDCVVKRLTKRRSRRVWTQLPGELENASFERNPIALMPAENTALARRYAENVRQRVEAGEGLWLWGGVGTGKTTVAAAIAVRARYAGLSFAFWRHSQLLQHVRTQAFQLDRPERTVLGDFAAVDLLVIDDLGGDKTTEWGQQTLCDLLDMRIDAALPVLVTTNFGEEALREHIGERALSRLYELAGLPRVFEGPDHRKLRAEAKAAEHHAA